MKEFTYDFFSLFSKDIAKWSKNFFWPVSRNETQRILTDILEIFYRNIDKEKNMHIRNCLITYNQFYNPYVIIFNYLLLKERISKKNYKINYSKNSKVMRYLFQESNEFPIKLESFNNKNIKDDYLRLLKDKLKTFLFNFVRGNLFPNNSIFAINQQGVLDQDYFKNNRKWINIISVERLKRHMTIKKSDKELLSVINSLHCQCLKYSKEKLKIRVSKKIEKDILLFQMKYLQNVSSLLLCFYENKELQNIKEIFVDTPKTVVRAISLVTKKNGGNVYGFPHGSWICHSFSKRPIYNEFLLYDYFCIYNNSQKELFSDNLKKNLLNLPIKFISQDSKIFHKYRMRYKSKLPRKIETVMILESQLWCDDIRFELPETMIIYEFYYYLCSFLSSLGYKILFKKRPKSHSMDFSFFQNIQNIEIITGDLKEKKILNLPDVIIFMYGLSSTFIPLICSNKKLIFFDCGWERWNPKVLRELKKRCDIVKTFNTADNKIRFKKSTLIKSLNITKKNLDTSFFDKYLSMSHEKK